MVRDLNKSSPRASKSTIEGQNHGLEKFTCVSDLKKGPEIEKNDKKCTHENFG